jgi:hypothetical protein
MPSRAARRTDGSVLERARPNPFRTTASWSLGPGGPVLELASTTSVRARIPDRPTLLTGGSGPERRATIDRIVDEATRSGWLVERVDARGRGRHIGDALERTRAALLGAGSRGVLVCIDDLHAAEGAECEALLSAITTSARTQRELPVCAVASAAHRSSLATHSPATDVFDEIDLRLDVSNVVAAFGSAASEHGRMLHSDAANAIYEASDGDAGTALELAAAAWDATRGDVVTSGIVAAVRPNVDAALRARLRASQLSRFSLGQRRYLRAVSAHGGRQMSVSDVQRTLSELTRFELTESMLDAVSGALVRQGVLIVHEGFVTIAVPGLAQAV